MAAAVSAGSAGPPRCIVRNKIPPTITTDSYLQLKLLNICADEGATPQAGELDLEDGSC
jgi:hypothetical protein